ncbi:Cysteine desulfurase [Streptococcus sp. DD12]|nr:Cysteine desulfurase [Streptococcus sp. DD12]
MTAIQGYALANQAKGKHLITTAIEHHSVLHTMAYLEERFGFSVTYLTPKDGQNITAQQVKEALRPDTILVSTMFANNETGDLLPIQEIGALLADHQAVFHVDAVQAVGKVPLHPQELGIDFLSASAHKFHGPKGVGFLYSAPLHFDALLHGGEQEDKRRASTENLIGIAAMAEALEDSLSDVGTKTKHIEKLRQTFLNELTIPYQENRLGQGLPHVLNLGFLGANNNTLLTRLDLAGFCVSTGSACTAGTVDPSHVLSAYYGSDSPRLTSSIRISFGDQNTLDEAKSLAQTINTILGD